MTAEIIRLDSRREFRPVLTGRRLDPEVDPLLHHDFWRHRDSKGSAEFVRGRDAAVKLIERADQFDLEEAFSAIVTESMTRRVKGGQGSRKPFTPASNGFVYCIAWYIATGKLPPRATPGGVLPLRP